MAIGILILIAVIIYFVAFNKSKKELNQTIHSQGGMEFKYQVLLDKIRGEDSKLKITALTENTLTLSEALPNGYLNFHLTETFDKLHVRFNLQDKILGLNKFDWDFNPKLNQDRMFEEIQQGLALFDTRVSNKKFY